MCDADLERAGAAPVLETSLDLLAWRDALPEAATVPGAVDLADWARMLAGAGHRQEAALLSDVAALHEGFSPHMLADRAHPFGRTIPLAGDDALTRAMIDLRSLGHAIGTAARSAHAIPVTPTCLSSIDLAEAARMLRESLEQPDAVASPAMAATLAGLVAASRRMPTLDHRALAAAPLPVVVPAIAAVALIDFALRTRDLWGGAWGSPALLHQAARFDPAGLGPYLTNVGRLAPRSRDVAALARVACEAAGATGVIALEPWIALLSRGCVDGLLRETIDDLGDVGAGEALLTILDRETSRIAATIDVTLLTRLRDAGLDNADHALAKRAQAAVVSLRPDSALEGMILGTIEASAGERVRAAATFRRWLARYPEDGDLRARLDALEADRFEPFAIDRGFGSPADRQARRLRRRGVLPDHPHRRGERIDAVAVR